LGLASAYGIAKQHNGWINVYSQVGHGSTFKLYLPATDRLGSEKEVYNTLILKDQKGRGQRILLVEDEPGVQKLASMLLRANGYQVMVAATAREAADIFLRENGKFDLVFCDVVLPDKNGLQLVEQFIASKPDLRIMMTSGYSDQQSRWPAIQAKGWRFLQKPYPVATLLQSIAAALQPNPAA
jgi:CheY-like chemotaxis protein